MQTRRDVGEYYRVVTLEQPQVHTMGVGLWVFGKQQTQHRASYALSVLNQWLKYYNNARAFSRRFGIPLFVEQGEVLSPRKIELGNYRLSIPDFWLGQGFHTLARMFLLVWRLRMAFP